MPIIRRSNCYNRTDNYRQWNAVGSPDDGHKDARNILRYYWLPINHYLLHLVGFSFIYLQNSRSTCVPLTLTFLLRTGICLSDRDVLTARIALCDSCSVCMLKYRRSVDAIWSWRFIAIANAVSWTVRGLARCASRLMELALRRG